MDSSAAAITQAVPYSTRTPQWGVPNVPLLVSRREEDDGHEMTFALPVVRFRSAACEEPRRMDEVRTYMHKHVQKNTHKSDMHKLEHKHAQKPVRQTPSHTATTFVGRARVARNGIV